MPRRLILRAAIGLTLLLVVASMAFALATSLRERRLASAAATVSASPSAKNQKFAAASFETRCAKCHEMEEMQDWLAANAGAGQSAQLLAFLKAHKKAPDPENEAITRLLSESKAPAP
jgi:cytochrome c553